ncbi:MAG: hypothetical protein ACLUVD_09510 [Mediterraneibacter faecis]
MQKIKPDAGDPLCIWTAVDMAEDDDKVAKVRAINAGGTAEYRRCACKKLTAR